MGKQKDWNKKTGILERWKTEDCYDGMLEYWNSGIGV
jgi:hypothetical protein